MWIRIHTDQSGFTIIWKRSLENMQRSMDIERTKFFAYCSPTPLDLPLTVARRFSLYCLENEAQIRKYALVHQRWGKDQSLRYVNLLWIFFALLSFTRGFHVLLLRWSFQIMNFMKSLYLLITIYILYLYNYTIIIIYFAKTLLYWKL